MQVRQAVQQPRRWETIDDGLAANDAVDDALETAEMAEYRVVLSEVIRRLSGLVEREVPFRMHVRLETVPLGRTTIAVMVPRFVGDDATACTIRVTPLGRGLGVKSKEMRSALAHEAWHCFQATKLGRARYYGLSPWLGEGMAMWVGEAFVDGTTMEPTVRHWNEYLNNEVDREPMFARSYDAVGFYAHLVDEDVNVWRLLDKLLDKSPDNARAFEVALAGTKALSSWGTSFFLDPTPTQKFTMKALRPAGLRFPRPKQLALGNGDTGIVNAQQPATNDFADVVVSTDVLTIEVGGRGMLGDMAGPVYELAIGSRSFCVKAPCKCPDGSIPIEKLTPRGTKSRIAVSGDALSGSHATLTAYSIEEFCKGPKPPERHTWQGEWKSSVYPINGTFSLDVTMTSSRISGTIAITGSDCVTKGAVEGHISAGVVEFGTVDAGPRVVWNGKISGPKMQGTFTAEGCGDDGGSWSAKR